MVSNLILPKTLIVDLSKNYGGATSRVLSLMSRFPKNQVALATLKSSAITKEAQHLDFPVHIVGVRKTDLRIIPNLIRLIRTERFQVLDSQNIQSKFYASIATTITHTSLVSTINSWYANEHGKSSTKGKIYTALELATNWNLSLYITVSEKDRQALLQSRVKEDDIELIYNAIENNKITKPSYKKWLHKEFDLSPNARVCLAVGRLVPIKGYDILIEAVRQASKEIHQLICVILGEGESREELRKQIEQTGMENNVILAGYRDRRTVLNALGSCDVFAMPSRYEGTPIALLEAASLGCPILASATGGIPELVHDTEHALLVPVEDTAALAQGIVKLCNNQSLARQLGEKAQQRVQEKFNLTNQVTMTLRAYHKAWSKHNREI
jgi:glycosyltransferase involved in cell wall biosynthesis